MTQAAGDLKIRCDVVSQFAVQRRVPEVLALAIQVVMITDDRARVRRDCRIPPLLEPAQVAVLRARQALILIVAADDPVDRSAGRGDQSQFLDDGLVAVGTHGRCHGSRIVVVEIGEPTVLRVEAGVLARDIAVVVVLRGARRQRGKAEVDIRLEGCQIDVSRGGFELDRSNLIVRVRHAVAVRSQRGRAPSTIAVRLTRDAESEVHAVAWLPLQSGTAV